MLEKTVKQFWNFILEHNRPWSRAEVAVFLFLLLFMFGVCTIQYLRRKIRFCQVIASLLLLTYLWIVLESTVLTRTPRRRYTYELELFWSWKRVIYEHSRFLLKENLLNILLLVPAGVLLPVVRDRGLRWYGGLLVGVLISSGIELLQLVMKRGLFEFDDIVHNGLGCMLGCVIASCIYRSFSGRHG